MFLGRKRREQAGFRLVLVSLVRNCEALGTVWEMGGIEHVKSRRVCVTVANASVTRAREELPFWGRGSFVRKAVGTAGLGYASSQPGSQPVGQSATSQPAAFCSSGNVQGRRKFLLLARLVVGRGRTITRLSRHKPRGREAMRWDSIGYDRIR